MTRTALETQLVARVAQITLCYSVFNIKKLHTKVCLKPKCIRIVSGLNLMHPQALTNYLLMPLNLPGGLL